MPVARSVREERERLHADGLKRCSRCKSTKPCAEFGKRAGAYDGLHPYCRECVAAGVARTREGYRTRWKSEDPYINPEDKRCSACKGWLPRTCFSRESSRVDGLHNRCKDCSSSASMAAGERHRSHWATHDPYADRTPKRCSECRQQRPRSDFARNAGTHDGLHFYCKGCDAARVSAKRAKTLGQWVEDVDRNIAWELAGGICYLCSEAVPRERFDLDHVDPVINGGEHSYFNTAPTHVYCNRAKGGKPWPDVSFDPAL